MKRREAICALGCGTMVSISDAVAAAPVEIARSSLDSIEGWSDCGSHEDIPMSYGIEHSMVREGRGAVRLTLHAEDGPVGMKYFKLPPVAGSDGFTLQIYGDGSGVTLRIRLLQKDGASWEVRPVRVDFTGWRKLVISKDECRYRGRGQATRNWDGIATLAPRLANRTGGVVLDDLRFFRETSSIRDGYRRRAAGPVSLIIDSNRELPPIPDLLKGVDFALINWGAGQGDLNFGSETERLFVQSGARLVRFWTFCPPFRLSREPGRYDWTRFDAQMEKIKAAGAQTIMTCCFTPTRLSADGTKEGVPKDWDQYERLIMDTVEHCRAKDWPVRYWEVWNEPNLQAFLHGDLDDFLRIYTHFVKAVRSADPGARVGGGAFSRHESRWTSALLNHTSKNQLPLDFVSWHLYDQEPDGVAASINATRKQVSAFPEFRNAELIVDEWNAAHGPQNAYDTEFSAAAQAAIHHRMLEAGVAASTFFAFKDRTMPGREFGGSWGMITSRDTPKSSYQSFRIFSELNGPRLPVKGGDHTVGAVATHNGGGVDVMVYRFKPESQDAGRVVEVRVEGWDHNTLICTLETVDDRHSNPLANPPIRELQQTRQWTGLTVPVIRLSLPPLAVGRLRFRSS